MTRPSAYIGPRRPDRWRDLLAAMRDEPLELPAAEGELRALLADAHRNEVGPNVAHALRRSGDQRSEVVDAHRVASDRIKVMLAAADDVASVLDGVGIPTLALKNVGIARAIYPCAACTPMGDIDLVVRRSDFRKAHELLLAHSLVHDTRAPEIEPADIDHAYESGGAEYRYQTGSQEVWIELQWRPVAGRWIRPHQEFDADYLVARSRPIEASDLRLLDATDNMLQVALHTAKHSYCRAPGLRLHTDVHRLATYDPPDWDALLAAAHQMDVVTAVYFSLDIAATLLGSPVPEEVLNSLRPGAPRERFIQGMLRRASIFEPGEAKFNRAEMLALHGLLYDDMRLLAASVMDSDPSELRLAATPHLAGRALVRLRDVLVKYQR
jgi:hypothetical protein